MRKSFIPTLDGCLFRCNIPLELRYVITQYTIKPLDNESIQLAIALWRGKVDWSQPKNYSRLFLQYPTLIKQNTSQQQELALLLYGHISEWNTSSVTSLKSLFQNQDIKGFDENIEHWDVSNVTDMSYLFAFVTTFNQPLNNWNVHNVVNMEGMFFCAMLFNQPLDMWDTSSVTTMKRMFAGAENFNQPLHRWEVNQVESMENMFQGAKAFRQRPLTKIVMDEG